MANVCSRVTTSVVRFFFRSGRSLGLIVFAAALVGLLYPRFYLAPGVPVRSAWTTDGSEGYYFAGVQYQITLHALRLAVSEVHAAGDEAKRAERRRDALVWRDTLHAKLAILTEAPEISGPLRTVPGFNDAVRPLTQMDLELDGLVSEALRDQQGLARFEQAVGTTYPHVIAMVKALRVAELSALEAAFESERRFANAYLDLGFALLAVLGIGVFFYVHFARNVRRSFKQEAEARAEAQRSSQARTALLGMVSHELRTPLQTMLANVELLAVRSPQDGTVDIIERLMRCIELISGQLDNIAHYTRLTNGSMEIRRERFIVPDLLRRIVEEHASAAKANHQVITVDAPHGADVTIHGDPIRLHQVINNYLANAIKYASPGRISIVVRLLSHQFGDLRVADAVEVIVEDEGPGISAAESASLWEPFVRGKPVSSSRKGSGLGLAVVKLLATSVGWDVGVRTEPGHGAAFYVVLPLIGPNLASPPLPPPAAAS